MHSTNKTRAHILAFAVAIMCGSAHADQREPLELLHASNWLDATPLAGKTAGNQAQKPTLATIDRASRAAIAASARMLDTRLVETSLLLEHPIDHLPPDALPILHYRQHFNDIPVFGARVNVLLDDNHTPQAIVGTLGRHGNSATWPDSALGEIEVLSASISALTGAHLEIKARQAGTIGKFNAYIPEPVPAFHASQPVRIRPVWYPSGNLLRPAYQVEIIGSRPGVMHPVARSILVSAIDGRELQRDDLIYDLQSRRRPEPCGEACPRHDFSYRVFANRRKAPYIDPFGFTSPHPTGVPDASLPSQPAPMHLLRLKHAGISTSDPWLSSDATHTVGNNADAFFKALPQENGRYITDIFQDWSNQFNADAGDHRAPLSASYTFDYAYDVELAPNDYFQFPGALAQPIPVESSQFNARIVQAFYVANWLHDLFYDLGFDEVAGNMQMDNFGRGGADGDPLGAIAGFSNTFTFTPADGVSPAIVLGHNAFGLSNRDVSALDFGVLTHEWIHILVRRLSGMPGGSGQQGALHEGIADFVAMFLMVQHRHRRAPPNTGDFHGAYPVGAYWNLDYDNPQDDLPPAGTPGQPDNTYYHGIRRFPYSASFDINPLTFGHISPENPLPDGFEPFDWKFRSLQSFEIHTAGEVWASALWQCARNILADTSDRGFRNARRRFLASLVAALKMIPVDATYTDARDAVLMAVRVGNEDEFLRCRAGFAERGLGANAVSPPRDSVEFREVIEDFTDADPPALRSDVQSALTSGH